VVYGLIMLAVGVGSARYMRSLDDFVLGGRRLGPWVTAISERASGESAWFILGLPGAAYASGFTEYWAVIGIASGIFASWVLIARPLRRASGARGALTLPDYFESRFDDNSRLLRIFSLLVILFFYTLYLAAQFVGAGAIFNATFGLDTATGILLGAVVVTLYTLMGGFLAVALTDLLQGLLMAFVAVALPILGIIKLGGPGAFLDTLAPRGADFLSLSGGQVGSAFVFGVMFSSLAWGFGYLGQPHLLTRYMAIRRTSELRKGAGIAMGWVLLAYWGAAMIGIVGAGLLPNLDVASGQHEQIMPLMAKSLLPAWAAGFVIAGAVAAMMSTADSQLLVASSTLVEDVYARLAGGKGNLVLISRIVTVVIAAAALILALGSAETIYKLVEYAWTGLGSSFGPALLLSLYWRRTTRWGALAGMVTGTVATVTWKNVGPLAALIDIKISSFLLALIATVVVSLLTRSPARS